MTTALNRGAQERFLLLAGRIAATEGKKEEAERRFREAIAAIELHGGLHGSRAAIHQQNRLADALREHGVDCCQAAEAVGA